MPYKKNSLSKDLQNAKKHFKIKPRSTRIEKAIVDMGYAFLFSQNSIFTDLPAGTYHIGSDRTNNFMLTKSSKKTIVDSEDQLEDLIEALSSLGNETMFDNEEAKNKILHEASHDYLSTGYFPLQHHNKGLKFAYDDIVSFLNNKDFYDESDLGFKRSILLYGTWGVGKSRFLDWISKEIIRELDAITIRLNSVPEIERLNTDGSMIINQLSKNRLIVFIVEEMSQIADFHSGKVALLHLLDNPLLRDNILFLSTTNNPERIPANIIARYQRMDQVIEISSKDNSEDFVSEFFKFVFKKELPKHYKLSDWFKDDLSPSALKELFTYSKLSGVDLDESYKRVLEREKLVRNKFDNSQGIGFNFL
ncbi:MAG: AAA family ATPase [Balneola sp.]